jgi:hypothetical protein
MFFVVGTGTVRQKVYLAEEHLSFSTRIEVHHYANIRSD